MGCIDSFKAIVRDKQLREIGFGTSLLSTVYAGACARIYVIKTK